jgi:hypothetical protein
MSFHRVFVTCLASVLVLTVLAATAGADGGGLDLATLMRRMAASSGVVARFREQKEMALLAVPLESSGVLYFAPPGRLARFTQQPSYSSLIIDGEELRFRESEGGEEFDLSGNPMARIFVDNFIVLFNGDLDALKDLYDTRLEGTPEAWTLELAPRRAPLDRVMEAITLHGGETGIERMVMLAKDGDRTTTRLESVDSNHGFSEAELVRLFTERLPLEPAAQQ